MDANVKVRIGRAVSELAEIEDRGAAHFGFGVFTPSDTRKAHHGGTAQVVKRFCSRKSGDAIRSQPPPWVTPSPTGECQIRWWGNRAGIDFFRPWVVRFVTLISRLSETRTFRRIQSVGQAKLAVVVPDSEADFSPPRHTHDALLALVRFATKQEGLRSSVEVKTGEVGCFYDVKPWAIRFVRAVAEHVQAGPTARLIVNTVTSSVTFDGHTTFPDISWIRVLTLLQEAKGQPMIRRAMQETDRARNPYQPILNDYDRLDQQIIKPIKKRLHIPIMSCKMGYFLPPDCLSEE